MRSWLSRKEEPVRERVYRKEGNSNLAPHRPSLMSTPSFSPPTDILKSVAGTYTWRILLLLCKVHCATIHSVRAQEDR